MKLENKNILIISGEAWGPVWFSKHNYAWQLSKNNKVFFLNPPERFSPQNILRSNLKVEVISPSLTVITYKNILPVKYKWLEVLNENHVFKLLKNYFDSQKISQLIFWTFDPIRLSAPEKLDSELVIVHAVDRYLFTYRSEKILSKKANLVFCVSKEISEVFSKYSTNTHLIPHAIPADEFLPPKANTTKQLSGIFAGTLDLRIDFEYLDYILQKFPAVTFTFVGRINIKNTFTQKLLNKEYSNAVFEGEKPFAEVKYYIQNADFCILFKDNNLNGNSISSHKMLQYLAQGKPVFCTELSQHTEIASLLYMDNDKFKMEKLLRNFVEHGEEAGLSGKRIAFAKDHVFATTLKKIEQLLN